MCWSIMQQLQKHFSRQSDSEIIVVFDLSRSDERISKYKANQFWSLIETVNEGLCSVSFRGELNTYCFDTSKIKVLVTTNLSKLEIKADGHLSSDRFKVIGEKSDGVIY